MIQKFTTAIGKLFAYDFVYAGFWLAAVAVFFFLPVMLERQSLAEAVPAFYSRPYPDTSIKTLWQVDGGFNTVDVIPLIKSEIKTLKTDAFPLWTPYAGGGEPQLVSNTVSIYYPLRLVFFFIWNSAHALDWYFIQRFFIAGLGMFFYLRLISLRRVVSLWGGIAYAFSGYFILYLTYPFLDIDALLPWTLLTIEYYCRKKSIAAAALIGFLLAITIVIGQPQSTIIAFMLAALYFVWRTLVQNSGTTGKKILVHSIAILLTADLIALPFIIDFLINYSQGETIDAWRDKGLTHFPPIYSLHFLVPPSAMPEVAASGHLFDRFYLIIPYVGLSVLLLFLLSWFIRKKPPQLAPFYIWTGFVILKNAGFPLVQWLGDIPIFSQIGWYKAYGPLAGAMVICAAIAFEHVLGEEKENPAIQWRGFYKFIAFIPLIFAAAYVFFRDAFLKAYVPNFDFFNRHPQMIEKITALAGKFPAAIKRLVLYAIQNHGGYLTAALFVEAALFAAGTLLIISYLKNPQHKRRAAIIMVLFTTFELWVYMPKIRDGFRYFDPYAETPPYTSFLQNKMEKEGVSRTFSVGNVFMGHIGELYKIQKSQNNSSIKSLRYFEFLPDEILGDDPLTGTVNVNQFPAVPQKFFDAYDIRYLLSEQTLANEPWLKLIYDEDIKIYENKNVLPKAYIVFQKETAVSPEEARKLFYDKQFDPHQSVILEDKNAVSLEPNSANAFSYARAAIANYKDNEVDLSTETESSGILVLTDLFYPGWQAYLDGKKVSTYPANVMFRGIYLPAGSHSIKFIYEPRWFWPSAAISFITIAGVIVLFILERRKKI